MPSHIETLMNNISPKIYEENPFRVLDLSVGAHPEEVEKKAQKLITARKLHINLPNYRILSILGYANEADEYGVQKAMDDIRNPHKRLLYELFWFHFEPDGKNTNLEIKDYLFKGEFDKAAYLWQSFAKDEDQHVALWAAHNLAVLYHSRAIGNETRETNFTAEHTEYWQTALQYWHKVWSQERFWDYFKKRVFELDDARLKAVDIETMRNKFPFILKINTALALKYLRNGKREYGFKHLQFVKESKYNTNYVAEILGELSSFIRENFDSICEDTKNQLNDIDKNSKIASSLRVIYNDFFAKAEPEIKTIEVFSTNMPVSILRDKFAKTLRRIGNSYRYHLWDCKKAQEILNEALEYAGSEMLKETIKNDIKAAREDIFAKAKVGKDFNPSACWFCGSELRAEDKVIDSIIMKMHKVIDVKTEYYGTSYRTNYTYRPLTITIPRCRNCNQYHKITNPWMCLGFLGIFIYVIGAIPMAAAGYIIGHFIAAKKNKAINYDIYTLSIPLIIILGTLSMFFGFWSILFMLTKGYMLYNFITAKLKKEKRNKLSICALILIALLGLINISHFGTRILLATVFGAIAGHFIAFKRKKRTKNQVNLAIRPKPYLFFNLYPFCIAARRNGYVNGEKPAAVS